MITGKFYDKPTRHYSASFIEDNGTSGTYVLVMPYAAGDTNIGEQVPRVVYAKKLTDIANADWDDLDTALGFYVAD
jgi:hypothetical protein